MVNGAGAIQPDSTGQWIRRILPLLLGVYAAGYLFLIFQVNINWDEFNFLTGIYAIQEGRATARLNDFHTVLYGWLTAVAGMEIDQIIVARIVQFGLFAGSMLLLFLLARALFSGTIALIVVFLAVTYSDMVFHAFSFRFDPICLLFSLLALYLVHSCTGLPSAAVAGLALALSFLVSIKTVFYAIPIAVLMLHALTTAGDARAQVGRIAVFAASAALFFVSIYLVRTGAPADAASGIQREGSAVLETLQRAGRKMFLEDGFLPRPHWLSRGLSANYVHWLLVAAGSIIALIALKGNREHRNRAALILICLLPLASVLIYRNAFPYFYVYVMPPALLAAGLAIEFLANAARRFSGLVFGAVLMAPVALATITSLDYLSLEHREGIEKQRQVLAAIHQMFPEPVPYIDAHGMVSSFPKHGLWMSTWGMDNYHEAGTPIFKEILREHQPRFVLVNHEALRLDGSGNLATGDHRARLLAEDWMTLSQNFIDHWGPLYVAGKRIEIQDPGRLETFEMLIEGPYTIEFSEPVLVNGGRVEPGGTVELAQGPNSLESPVPGTVTLRWGSGLPVPDFEPPQEWLWDGL